MLSGHSGVTSWMGSTMPAPLSPALWHTVGLERAAAPRRLRLCHHQTLQQPLDKARSRGSSGAVHRARGPQQEMWSWA